MAMRLSTALVSAVAALALSASELEAQEEGSDPPAHSVTVEAGDWHWGISSGYGRGVDLSSQATYLGDVRFVGLTPAVGREVMDGLFHDRWFRGRAALLLEGALLPGFRPTRGFGAGVSLNARYTAAMTGRWAPFLVIGAGPMYLDFNNENQADGLSFILQAGGGVEQRLTPSLSLVSQVRLHHMSNAGLRRPNPGINDVLFLVGFSHYLR
jgi:lipid A 3-O-deacylase